MINMIKRIALITTIFVMGSALLSPLLPSTVMAEQGKTPTISAVQVLDNNTDTRLTGNRSMTSRGNEQEYTARIYSAPKYNDDGSILDCAWHHDDKTGTYYIEENIFSLTVEGRAVSTTYQGQTLTWNPTVYVGSTEYTAKRGAEILDIDPVNSNYRNNTLEWDYGICIRHLRVIEGMTQETWIFKENPHGTVWVKDNTAKSAGFVWQVAPYAYDANGNSVVINEYKQVSSSEFDRVEKEGGYPVVIDPTETYLTSASDGYAYKDNITVYATGHNIASGTAVTYGADDILIGQTFTTKWSIWRGYLFFDTSALPDDATITSANVGLRGETDESDANFNISLQTSNDASYPHNPITIADYDYTKYTGYGGNFSTVGFNASGWNNISMSATGLTWISLTGTTIFCIRSNEDIITSQPGLHEYVKVFSSEKGAGYVPFLEVTYTVPPPTVPAVTTQDATYITTAGAQLNGLLGDAGATSCNVSFEYSHWLGAVWGSSEFTANQSKSDGQTFLCTLNSSSPLIHSSGLYRFRAVAVNSLYTTNGSYLNFSTAGFLDSPTNIFCSPHSTSIDLSWTKGGNTSQTHIRWKTGGYPTDISDGTGLTNQSSGSYTQTGLTAGTSYYYRMWGIDGGAVSATNSTLMCTTLAPSANASSLAPPVDPANWVGAIDDSNLADLPIYGIGNEIADTTSIPHATFWMWTSMGLLVIVGVIVYGRTKNIFLTVLIVSVMMIALGALHVVPMAVVAIFLLGVFAMTAKEWHQAGTEGG
jgi:hypothetical protein